jgi:hypothetical protein
VRGTLAGLPSVRVKFTYLPRPLKAEQNQRQMGSAESAMASVRAKIPQLANGSIRLVAQLAKTQSSYASCIMILSRRISFSPLEFAIIQFPSKTVYGNPFGVMITDNQTANERKVINALAQKMKFLGGALNLRR